MTDDNPSTSVPVATQPPTPRDRLRREGHALWKLAKRIPKAAAQTPEMTAALHTAIDAYVLVWRSVRLAAGMSIDGVFPPADDPALELVPRDRRPGTR